MADRGIGSKVGVSTLLSPLSSFVLNFSLPYPRQESLFTGHVQIIQIKAMIQCSHVVVGKTTKEWFSFYSKPHLLNCSIKTTKGNSYDLTRKKQCFYHNKQINICEIFRQLQFRRIPKSYVISFRDSNFFTLL